MASVTLPFLSIARQPRRSLMAILAIAFGISALLLASGFIEWNLRYGRESTIHSELGHIRIFKPGYLLSGSADPFDYLLEADAKLEQAILSVPHVELITPRLSFNGLASYGESTLSFVGEGVDPHKEERLSKSLTITSGQSLSADHPKGIIVGQGLAENLGIKPSDSIVLMVNSATGGVNAAEVTVLGLFATITKAYDDAALRVPISLARQLMRVTGSHSYTILLDKTENTSTILDDLKTSFGKKGFEFVPWYRMADFYNKTAELFSRQVSVVRLIIAVIIVLSISNTLMMSVMERTGEIGTIMALGVKRREVLIQFLAEGFILGVAGGSLGLILAYALGALISAIGVPMPAPPGMSFGYTAEILISWQMAFEAFLLAIITTLVASVIPAVKASRMEIVNALRHNR
ncbi:MAG: ABC transporter permease [Gammaproteobacteria bacterium]|nr:ABC transporter permease [Gammaproteobacteria bacterium]MBU2435815.1 ABC transporter permease [Gammaproteobacteria bacterium]MBU2449404.1 ABC transporter permease [Gammaproteobacteria bacterium]